MWTRKNRWLRDAHDELLRRMRTPKIASSAQPSPDVRPEERLVVVYGKAQVGKTALILYLAGVREENMRRVNQLIRGSAKQGSSSTSHAFLYTQSEDDFFYVWTKRGVASEPGQAKRFDREEDVSGYIDGLRQRLNEGSGLRDVICLSIPRKYCRRDEDAACQLNLLDLPGIGSKDQREKPHIDRLLEQYARLAAAIIVVCTRNQIQELSRMQVPVNGNRWWADEEKYIIVMTYFYSTLENHNRLLDKCADGEELCDRARDLCYTEVGPVYDEWRQDHQKKRVPLQIFPMELDESYRCYLKELDEKQKGILTSAQRKMSHDLCGCIARRKNGDSFLLFIRALNNSIELFHEKQERRLAEDTAYHEREKENWEGWQKALNERAAKRRERRERLEGISRDARAAIVDRWEEAAQRIEECCTELGKFSSPLRRVLPLTEAEQAHQSACRCIEALQACFPVPEFDPERAEKFARSVDDLADQWSQMLRDRFRGSGVIHRPSIETCQDLFRECAKAIWDGCTSHCMEHIQVWDEQAQILTHHIQRAESFQTYTRERADAEQRELDRLKAERDDLENLIKEDQKTLQNAKAIARKHYIKQRGVLIEELKQSKHRAQQTGLLLVLAAMEQDYNNDIVMAGV